MASWALLRAHTVTIAVEHGEFDPAMSAMIADSVVVDPGPLVLAVPLILMGAGVCCAFGLRPSSPANAVLIGGATVFGYLPAMLLIGAREYSPLLLLFNRPRWAVGFSISPDLPMAAAVAGVCYPAVFCGFGALCGYVCVERFLK
jgi:hypothetical protein